MMQVFFGSHAALVGAAGASLSGVAGDRACLQCSEPQTALLARFGGTELSGTDVVGAPEPAAGCCRFSTDARQSFDPALNGSGQVWVVPEAGDVTCNQVFRCSAETLSVRCDMQLAYVWRWGWLAIVIPCVSLESMAWKHISIWIMEQHMNMRSFTCFSLLAHVSFTCFDHQA